MTNHPRTATAMALLLAAWLAGCAHSPAPAPPAPAPAEPGSPPEPSARPAEAGEGQVTSEPLAPEEPPVVEAPPAPPAPVAAASPTVEAPPVPPVAAPPAPAAPVAAASPTVEAPPAPAAPVAAASPTVEAPPAPPVAAPPAPPVAAPPAPPVAAPPAPPVAAPPAPAVARTQATAQLTNPSPGTIWVLWDVPGAASSILASGATTTTRVEGFSGAPLLGLYPQLPPPRPTDDLSWRATSGAAQLVVTNELPVSVELHLDGAWAATVVSGKTYETPLPPGSYEVAIKTIGGEDQLARRRADVRARTNTVWTVGPGVHTKPLQILVENTGPTAFDVQVYDRERVTVAPGGRVEASFVGATPQEVIEKVMTRGGTINTTAAAGKGGVLRISNQTGHTLMLYWNNEQVGVLKVGETRDLTGAAVGDHLIEVYDVDSQGFSRTTLTILKAGQVALWSVGG